MQLIIFISLIIVILFIFIRKGISFVKTNLIKDQRAWSGKDIKITRKASNLKDGSSSNITKNNYLKVIAEESKIYLDEQS